MDKDALLALAERVEALTGPDRDADAEIARTVGRIPKDAAYEGTIKISDRAWHNGCGYEIPLFTASLDAAMTLVTDDHDYWISREQGFHTAGVYPQSAPVWDDDSSGATPAISLTAAALRARANQ